jgi:hypothetical protein
MRYLTCSASQHTGPLFHFGPHISTSCFLTSSSGSFAGPLSGQGNWDPKKPFFPQFPRIEHLRASCFGVYASLETRLIASRLTIAADCQRGAMAAAPPSGRCVFCWSIGRLMSLRISTCIDSDMQLRASLQLKAS